MSSPLRSRNVPDLSTNSDAFVVEVLWTWHRHNRPRIAVDTPPHVHAHQDGDDVEHVHPGLGNVYMIGR